MIWARLNFRRGNENKEAAACSPFDDAPLWTDVLFSLVILICVRVCLFVCLLACVFAFWESEKLIPVKDRPRGSKGQIICDVNPFSFAYKLLLCWRSHSRVCVLESDKENCLKEDVPGEFLHGEKLIKYYKFKLAMHQNPQKIWFNKVEEHHKIEVPQNLMRAARFNATFNSVW